MNIVKVQPGIVNVVSGDTVLCQVRVFDGDGIIINKTDGNAVLLLSEWEELITMINQAIRLAESDNAKNI